MDEEIVRPPDTSPFGPTLLKIAWVCFQFAEVYALSFQIFGRSFIDFYEAQILTRGSFVALFRGSSCSIELFLKIYSEPANLYLHMTLNLKNICVLAQKLEHVTLNPSNIFLHRTLSMENLTIELYLWKHVYRTINLFDMCRKDIHTVSSEVLIVLNFSVFLTVDSF